MIRTDSGLWQTPHAVGRQSSAVQGAHCRSLRFLHCEMETDDSESQRVLRPPTTEYTSRAVGASQIARVVGLCQPPPPPVNDVHDRPEEMSQISLLCIVLPAYYRPTHTSPPAFKSGLQESGLNRSILVCARGRRRDVGAGSIITRAIRLQKTG